MAVLRGFPDENIVAIYDEAPGGGAIDDIDAPRNRPAKNPGAWINQVYWHIDFFQYELAMPIQTVNVSHPSLSGRKISWGPAPWFNRDDNRVNSGLAYTVPGRTATTQRALVEHGLGYVPLAFVAYGDRMIMPGVAVQTASDGRNRFVAPYATASIVGLREVYNSSASALGAVSRTYRVMVFRVPEIEGQRSLFGLEGTDVILGRGKVTTGRRYLREVGPGDSPFSIDRGRTIDIRDGRARIVTGGVTTTESGYGGSFSGSPYIDVGT